MDELFLFPLRSVGPEGQIFFTVTSRQTPTMQHVLTYHQVLIFKDLFVPCEVGLKKVLEMEAIDVSLLLVLRTT